MVRDLFYIGSYKLCLVENYSHSAIFSRKQIDNSISSIDTPLLGWCPKKAVEELYNVRNVGVDGH